MTSYSSSHRNNRSRRHRGGGLKTSVSLSTLSTTSSSTGGSMKNACWETPSASTFEADFFGDKDFFSMPKKEDRQERRSRDGGGRSRNHSSNSKTSRESARRLIDSALEIATSDDDDLIIGDVQPKIMKLKPHPSSLSASTRKELLKTLTPSSSKKDLLSSSTHHKSSSRHIGMRKPSKSDVDLTAWQLHEAQKHRTLTRPTGARRGRRVRKVSSSTSMNSLASLYSSDSKGTDTNSNYDGNSSMESIASSVMDDYANDRLDTDRSSNPTTTKESSMPAWKKLYEQRQASRLDGENASEDEEDLAQLPPAFQSIQDISSSSSSPSSVTVRSRRDGSKYTASSRDVLEEAMASKGRRNDVNDSLSKLLLNDDEDDYETKLNESIRSDDDRRRRRRRVGRLTRS